MIDLQSMMSNRLQRLIGEAEALRPEAPIAFEVMTDEEMIEKSGGAALVDDERGETIYLDPERVNEYFIAHELMHVILHRTGWPRMYSILPEDHIAKRLADSLDNSLDHHVFNPRMKELGFDHGSYIVPFISTLKGWPTEEVQGPAFLFNTLKLFDGLIFSPKLRGSVIRTVGQMQPEMLDLARQLERAAKPAMKRKKAGVRQSMVALVDFLERWITNISGHEQSLRTRIGISPLFTERQLQEKASLHIRLQSHPFRLNSSEYWVGGLILKSDGTRIRNYVFIGPLKEPPEINEIRKRLETLSVEAFVKAERITKFGTYS